MVTNVCKVALSVKKCFVDYTCKGRHFFASASLRHLLVCQNKKKDALLVHLEVLLRYFAEVSAAYCGEKFGTESGVLFKHAVVVHGCGGGVLFLYTPHLHT